MKRANLLAAIAATALLAGPALAQGANSVGSAPNTPGVATGPNGTSATSMVNTDNNTTSKVTHDHQLRSSKLVGSNVYDEHNNSIGSIDDILLSQTDHAPNVVLSVGGFLGIGNKLIEVRYNKLKINNDGHVILPGATKDSLKAMTGYHYDNNA